MVTRKILRTTVLLLCLVIERPLWPKGWCHYHHSQCTPRHLLFISGFHQRPQRRNIVLLMESQQRERGSRGSFTSVFNMRCFRIDCSFDKDISRKKENIPWKWDIKHLLVLLVWWSLYIAVDFNLTAANGILCSIMTGKDIVLVMRKSYILNQLLHH